MLSRKNVKKDESGVVAILVVTVMTIILALVSLGFAKLMDRELGQATNRELSAQAYYSAQSGLNDAQAYLKDGGTAFTGCSNWPSLGDSYFVSDLSSGQNAAKYSCVSINTTPSELDYSLSAGQSVTVKVSLAQLNTFYFGWENPTYTNSPQPLGSLGVLPQEGGLSTDATGLLRVAVYPIPTTMPAGVTDTNSVLSYLSHTYFMYPNAGNGAAGTVNYTAQGKNGSFVSGNCNLSRQVPTNNPNATPRYCNAGITALDGGAYTYYLRLTAEYAPLNISVQATGNGNNTALNFNNAQGVVDVTGTGVDVLQRIRARIDLNTQYQGPSYGVQSMVALCKGFEAPVVTSTNYGTSTTINGSIPNSDNACATPAGGGNIVGTSGDLGPGSSRSCPAPYTGSYPNCRISTPPIIDSWYADSTSLPYANSGTILHWATSYATSCAGSGFNTGGNANGSAGTGSLSPGSHSYTITCSDVDGSVTSSPITVNVANAAPAANISANPTTVQNGGTTTIYWSSSNASSCYGNNFNTGGATSGAASVTLSTGTYYFYVTCSGPGGSVTSNSVYVTALPACGAQAAHNGNEAYVSTSCGSISSINMNGSYFECEYYGRMSLGCGTQYVSYTNGGSTYTFPSSGSSGKDRWVITNYSATFYVNGSYGSTSASVNW